MQTDNICKTLVFIISRFSRLKHILPSHMFMLIYSSIIQPKCDYAITIWGYTCDNNLLKIQRLQNRAARIVTGNYDYVTTRGTELVRRLRWMCDNNVFVPYAHLESFKNYFTHRGPICGIRYPITSKCVDHCTLLMQK